MPFADAKGICGIAGSTITCFDMPQLLLKSSVLHFLFTVSQWFNCITKQDEVK